MASSRYGHHFSSSNLPFGIAASKSLEEHKRPRIVTRFGNTVIFLQTLADAGLLPGSERLPEGVFLSDTLNSFASLPRPVHRALRDAVKALLSDGDVSRLPMGSFDDIANVTMYCPVTIGDFADFSCSLAHVQNAGRIVTNKDALPPSFLHHPIGYQGRASSVVVSGTPIMRPKGHFTARESGSAATAYGPSLALDYELEFAAVIGKPLPVGEELTATTATDHIFGFVLLNDWSARDIQTFEMAPLGPLKGKNFGTSISPWVISPDALEPFRAAAPSQTQPIQEYLKTPPLPTYDIRMRAEIHVNDTVTVTCESQVQGLHWTLSQAIAHLTSGGCGLRAGDIVATGTVSGSLSGQHGCLLERTWGGQKPIVLKDGSERRYLHDGDVVLISAEAGGPNSGVGFGECWAQIYPSKTAPP